MGDDFRVSKIPLVLDEKTIGAFVNEITGSLKGLGLVVLFDLDGLPAWHKSFLEHDSEAILPRPPEANCPLPQKRRVDPGRFAYDFTLECVNSGNHVISFVIDGPDTPKLAAVNLLVKPTLMILARQIDIDTTLSTTRLSVSKSKVADSLVDRLDRLPSRKQPSNTIQDILNACLAEQSVECMAAAIPDEQISVIAYDSGFQAPPIDQIIPRLYKPILKKRQTFCASITLPDGSKRRAICAPIFSEQKTVEGLVLLINRTIGTVHSKIARTTATKIASSRKTRPSKRGFLDRLEMVEFVDSEISRRPESPHSLVYFDFDKTHAINDAFGYAGGDLALAKFRQLLSRTTRKCDAVAHLGSDRFVLFFPGLAGDSVVTKTAEALEVLAEDSVDGESKSIHLSASAGVVDTHSSDGSAEDLLTLGEVASRAAKDRGGNQLAVYQDTDLSIIQRRSDADMVGFLQVALLENRFVMHAQRIESIAGDSGQKFELLVRLSDIGSPNVSPAHFLSAAERYQLMPALDRWVINSALTSIAEAECSLEVSLATFCINVSAQSLQDDMFLNFIETRISETGVSPDTLCFELTETSLVRYIDRAQKFVRHLQAMGCRVALDDFGTGYSSFVYLKSLPVDYLKIDGAFVHDVLENSLSQAIVSSVVQIADVIGAETVAEHVENSAVYEWLKQAGVNYAQGFTVHRPEPFADVLAGMDSPSDALVSEDTRVDLRLSATGELAEIATKQGTGS